MYIRLVLFDLKSEAVLKVEQLASDLGPAIESQRGCKGVTFFGGDDDGGHGFFVLWESKEDADAAAQVIGPKLQAGLAGNVEGPPNIRLYKVIER